MFPTCNSVGTTGSGVSEALAPDAPFDTLLQRLTADLGTLEKGYGLKPQIVIASGDLAEWGLRSEFEDARKFLEALGKFLGITRDRVVIVPGNHDINRKSCEAYFNQCVADQTDPVSPFWQKWKHFAAMFAEFYRELPAPPRFSVQEYWTWYEFTGPELKLVVAGLNSTVAEIHDVPEHDPSFKNVVESGHYGHFGWVGEAQLRWFQQKLEAAKKQGLFRIGVVHHNVQRGAAADDENLRDADRLDQFLGSSLNLLLHGHTHNSKIGWMNPHLPVLSTGSAALTKDARPEEVPNQYQIIRIWPDRLERWTRRFDLGKTRWEGDTGCSEHGDSWQIEHKVAFEAVNATFPVPFPSSTPWPKPDERNEGADMKGKSAEGRLPRSMSFLDRVAQVCKLRVPGAEVHALRGDDPKFAYLLVTVRDPMSVQQYPVGVCEMPITGEYLDGFLSNVDAKYRAADPGVKTELVHTGGKAPQELIDDARRRGIRLLSFVEYQGLIDFSPYQERQKQVLESDRVYPPSLYVSQRMRYSIGAGAAIWPESQSDDALETASGWLTDDDGRFVLILANFGSGKTFLLHKLALRLGDLPGAPAPILIGMRDLQRARTLDELIAQHLVARGEERIDIRKFRYTLETGKITLLFDGFDELAQRVTYDSATDHFDTLLQAAGGQAKVVVTSRTHHFQSDKQVKSVLLQRAEAHPGLRLCHLQPFNEEQIRGFLTNLLGDRGKAKIRLELIREVQDWLEPLGKSADAQLHRRARRGPAS